MNIEKAHNIYFIGIGGIGMSALARYFYAYGKNVSGYDRTPSPITEALQAEGITIHFQDHTQHIPETFLNRHTTLVVYTPAVPHTHNELSYFRDHKFQVLKRSQVLGLLSNHKRAVAVAGTHGKTSVSTMIAHLLHQSEVECSAFLGGIAKNYNSNWLNSKQSDLVVVEADEYDRSFLQLTPYASVITSADADHLDIYGSKENLQESFSQFAGQIQPHGLLLLKKGLEIKIPANRNFKLFSYALNDSQADFFAKKIELKHGNYHFDLAMPQGEIKNLQLRIPGIINVENAIAALAIAFWLGAKPDELRKALRNFSGIKRRLDYQIRTPDLIYIDDYAHHPQEIEACIDSIRKMYPGKKITGVFQPHLYTRTRDFAQGFAQSLDMLDQPVLLSIYPAREEPIPGVSSQLIFEKMKNPKKAQTTKKDLLAFLEKQHIEVLLTLGAGDIDRLVEPVKNFLETKKKR